MKDKIKLITTADVRDALAPYNRDEISYGKMVEMLNDAAIEKLHSTANSFYNSSNGWQIKSDESKNSDQRRYFQGLSTAYKYAYGDLMQLLYGKDWRYINIEK